jgi:hypothetical protein
VIVIHDTDGRPQHVLYEHPPTYAQTLPSDALWVQTRERAPAHEIVVERGADGLRHVTARGAALTTIRRSDHP